MTTSTTQLPVSSESTITATGTVSSTMGQMNVLSSQSAGGPMMVTPQAGTHPQALLLPNGQIVPVVTQPNLLLPGSGGKFESDSSYSDTASSTIEI